MKKVSRTLLLSVIALALSAQSLSAQSFLSDLRNAVESVKSTVQSAAQAVSETVGEAVSTVSSQISARSEARATEEVSEEATVPDSGQAAGQVPDNPPASSVLSGGNGSGRASAGRFARAGTASEDAVYDNTPDRFNADDPFDKKNFQTAGTPWEEVEFEPIKLPEGISVAIPEPLPDIYEISTMSYNSAVSMAVCCLQMIYGDMSEEEAQAFSDMWAPLYDSPSQEIINYLNKLNPLLTQFLVVRQEFMDSMMAYEALMFDAAEAADWEDSAALQEILAEVSFYSDNIKVLDATLMEITNRIGALGNPPSPLEARAAARRVYNRLFEYKQREVFAGESWMGTRPDVDYIVRGLPNLTEPMFRFLFRANVEDVGERFFVIELKERGVPTAADLKADNGLGNIDVVQYKCNNRDGRKPEFTSDGTFRTYFPTPPTMAIQALGTSLMMAHEMSYLDEKDKKDPEYAKAKQEYHEATELYSLRLSLAGFFFKAAMAWSESGKWDQYRFIYEDRIPHNCLVDFTEAVREQFRTDVAEHKAKKNKADKLRDLAAKANSIPVTPEQIRQQEIRDSLEREHKNTLEDIEERKSRIDSFRKSIERYKSDKDRYPSGSPEQKSIDQSIIGLYAAISNEQDCIRKLETGVFKHTYNVADAYCKETTIRNINLGCEQHKQAKRAAAGLYRMVSNLPPEQQKDAKERVDNLLYDKDAYVKDDLASMKKMSSALMSKIEGGALKEQSDALYEEANAEAAEKVTYAFVMGCGSLTAGLAGSALAATYGAEAAATIWGAKAIGAAYSGLTGYIAGGPGRAAASVANSLHPAAGVVASFLEGFYDPDVQGLSLADKWSHGVTKAGFDLALSAAFEAGTFIAVKGITAMAPKTKMNLFPPKKQKLDMLITQRQRLEAEDAVKAYGKMWEAHEKLIASGAPPAKIKLSENELKQMTASLNADYHAKWNLKYKADPKVRKIFDKTLQKNYDDMIVKMKSELDYKYDMTDVKFEQFRNKSSEGSSSMDLDLAPVSIKSGAKREQPDFLIKIRDANGKVIGTKAATAAEFMKDAQGTMNRIWKNDYKLSAKMSEMNLTTSAHPEAFSNKELLKSDIDWSKVKPEDVQSIGKVLEVKFNAIENNQMMTATTRMQAKFREASKECHNMLLPMLRHKQSQFEKGTKAYRDVQSEINLWTRMEGYMSRMGKGTSNPVEIHNIDIEIQNYTGGKGAIQVCNDLIYVFNPSFKPL